MATHKKDETLAGHVCTLTGYQEGTVGHRRVCGRWLQTYPSPAIVLSSVVRRRVMLSVRLFVWQRREQKDDGALVGKKTVHVGERLCKKMRLHERALAFGILLVQAATNR